ncbi:MAG: hypothetical protein SH850_23245 [Planctomycetaceae bacterium]|nr:hypothetical protein [Planctomycetaceae bacterium]
MPGDERKVSRLACFFLVALRLAIGWHLLYEGLWKLNTQATPTPWTAEGYLKNATGPMRDHFRNLTGDPNDLDWLDYDRMTAKWDDWSGRFVAHYPGATEAQGKRASVANQLDRLMNGQKEFAVPLEALPPGVDLGKWKNVLQFDAGKKRLIVDGKLHLLPGERDDILALAPPIENLTDEQKPVATQIEKFRKAVNDLYNTQSKLSFKERLAALLKGDPERVGLIQKEKSGAVVEERMGDVEHYKALIARYEANLAQAKTAFQWDHLQRQWSEVQQLRRQLVGPVQALEAELKTAATELLSEPQLAAGPVPEPMTAIRSINLQTMWGLTIIGGLLVAGLFTRLASIAGAGLLSMFYLAAPPWPGTPQELGIEHNFLVNKVLIEVIALLAFASLPTGRWFGVDALFAAVFRRRGR